MIATRSLTAQSARNAGVSILAQIVVVILGFVTRTVFVAELGVAMLGVNTLLTSTLALLAVADLGINGALMYALYKPLREVDTKAIAAIVRYAGRLFRWVALVVAILGLALAPFVHQLVRLEENVDGLEIYYLILLADTVVRYLMLNRLVLLNADQKIYLTKTYSLIFNTLRSIAQIVSLVVFGSFVVFLVIQVVFTAFNNVAVYHRAGRLYPYIKSRSTLPAAERRSIFRSTRAMLIYRLGGLVLNNSTALLVSVIVGTMALGYYSNYMLIVSAAVMIVEVAFSALTPSVGSLVATGHRGAGRGVFDEMVLVAILIHGLIAVGFVTLVDHFVVLWLGRDYVLPAEVVLAIVLNFYVTGTLMPLWSFRSATGLFRQTQWIMLITAGLSIALSFILGFTVGLVGVVMAPAIARLCTGAWYEPRMLIRNYLSGKISSYFGLQGGAFLLWCAIAGLAVWLGDMVPGDSLATMATKVALIAILFPAASWLAFRRTSAFQQLIRRFRALLRQTLKGSA